MKAKQFCNAQLSSDEKKVAALLKIQLSQPALRVRNQLSRVGLLCCTPKEAKAAIREQIKTVRNQHPGEPAWLSAARWAWLKVTHCPFACGKPVSSREVCQMAFEDAQWGRIRKRYRGDSRPAVPCIRTETNGKPGWRCVSWHHADYLLVLSPDGKKIAVQTERDDCVKVCSVIGRRFFFRGNPCEIVREPADPRVLRRLKLRNLHRIMKRAGYLAKLVRQTDEMIASGSGDNVRPGNGVPCTLQLVVSDGMGGWIHCSHDETKAIIESMIISRRAMVEHEYLYKMIRESKSIWVMLEDSIRAGNCRAGTKAFISKLERRIGATGELFAVKAEKILEIDDSNYAMRACAAAMMRMNKAKLPVHERDQIVQSMFANAEAHRDAYPGEDPTGS